MIDSNPLVSIGLPVYNGERYLRQALDSLLAQDYTNVELIISDNASVDETREICQEYQARDKRVQYHRSDVNMGAAWNFSRVFTLSSGEYFMWAAHDDYWQPQYISSCLEALGKSPEIVLVGARCDLVNAETGEMIFTDEGLTTVGLSPRRRFKRYKSIFRQRHIGGIFYGIYRSEALAAVMPMKRVIANDHLVLAGLSLEGEFVTLAERLIVKRWGGASVSHQANARAQGINNWLLVRCPYLVREVLLQKIIFKSRRLSLADKIRLAAWSKGDYIGLYIIRRIWLLTSGTLVSLRRIAVSWLSSISARVRYLASGRKPWTTGYGAYKERVLRQVLNSTDLLKLFLQGEGLPPHYGFRLDERVIEYPWVISRLGTGDGLLLDAGSSLNYPYILDTPSLKNRTCVIFSLSQETVLTRSNLSYVYGDLRHTELNNETFDEIVCISTLEHIGMNNTAFYSEDKRWQEFKPDDYPQVIREFRRLLRPGGRLFITVPYGRYKNHDWLQQFDDRMVTTVLDIFGGATSRVTYYRYYAGGWQLADAAACEDSSYFDIHKGSEYEPDYVAAARSVACLEMVK